MGNGFDAHKPAILDTVTVGVRGGQRVTWTLSRKMCRVLGRFHGGCQSDCAALLEQPQSESLGLRALKESYVNKRNPCIG
jgi:hypothetical protein